uniref:Voltage-dependent anion-selective channel protein 2-like n=2 Tax=Hirondellea gigas TaxID=1518452 RepID=A0A2P2HVR3_9CRUS
MSPPVYSDLGKQARDVFGKGYHFGVLKLECKTKSDAGVEVTAGGTNSIATGNVTGNLETKYKIKEHGLTFTEKWNTDNTLATELSLEDNFTKGLKFVLNSTFVPSSGKKSAVVKTTYKKDAVSVNLDSTIDLGGPLLNGAAVAYYKNWLLGYQMAFDTAKSKLTKNNFAVGFTSQDFTLHTYANDGAEFGGSLYHKISRDLEGAVDLGWSANSNTTRFSIGCKYALDRDACVRAKVNNKSEVGLGYQQRLREGVTLTLSTLIDGKNFNQGGHKIGLALELEA